MVDEVVIEGEPSAPQTTDIIPLLTDIRDILLLISKSLNTTTDAVVSQAVKPEGVEVTSAGGPNRVVREELPNGVYDVIYDSRRTGAVQQVQSPEV